ncbi:ExeM/NucH family extracellular endonuclease [Phaeobacter sp. HF9A]|uniref:ExeM/NucH family extracellular endonuclease n=1 Tax=Phaeobacter sp. HF9A TaxID=2721561 RepID=UPI00142FB836|nr:ExeM/NucH family extracellular endonuclease [Phaeobacter sp. HF9A]NIZ13797.1 ExeM/NucH family extracellular endonuclease [Phaeobacter sp. HF9A]
MFHGFGHQAPHHFGNFGWGFGWGKTRGSRGDDALSGTSGSDFIFGRGGNDTIAASAGLDYIDGGRGFDQVTFEGSILDATIRTFGLPSGHYWPRSTTALVSFHNADGYGLSTIRKVEALHFAADDYTFYLNGRNNAVLAGDDSISAVEDQATVLSAAELLENDHEFDGDDIAITSVDATSALGAAVSFENGEITYLPSAAFDSLAEGEVITDSFSYTVDDGKGGTDVATVTVTVTGSNDAPVLSLSDAAITIPENSAGFDAGVAASDVDTGDVLRYSLTGADAALFSIDAESGEIRFASAPDFEAPADANGDNTYELTVVVTDEFGASDSRELSVAVSDVWDPISLTQSFETEASGGRFTAPGTDGGALAIGTVVDVDNSGGATVDSTAASDGALGFDLSWENTRGDVGLSDGDFIGVTDYTRDVDQFSDGTQGYEMQDADGLLRLTFDTVDLSARADSTQVKISIDAFLNETGWESDDLVRVYVETNLGTVSLLDSTGQDIDDMDIEGAWTTLSTTLGADVTEATLIVELDSNSSAESLYLDNVSIEEIFYLGQSFEDEATGGRYKSAAADGNLVELGAVVDLNNVDGLATVDSTEASAGQLGYDLSWENTRNDSGISDGDFVGVQSYTGTVGSFTDGQQGYELSDADGLLRMTFDEIDLSAVGEVTLSLDTFVQSTGWEADDLVAIYVETDQGRISLLDSTGQDIDDMDIEGAWTTLSTTLDADLNSAQLVVELDSNSSSEALYVDNIVVTSDPAQPDDGGPDQEITLISTLQGEGASSDFVGEGVTVSAVVTMIAENGFYLQEEAADSDGNALTSEGIFVYTGGGNAVELGDLVQLSGTVGEYFGQTQIASVSFLEVISSGNDLPELTSVTLSPDLPQNYEALEGMRLAITSGTDEALTVIENFNLDRYGQVTISAGTQTQPTQIYDAQTQADEIAALQEANGNARLLLDDGSSTQNPDSIGYLPGGAGDNGNGVLDSGDDFSDTGTTVRLGAELANPVEGVLGFAFGEWTLTVTDTIEFTDGTNVDSREAAPQDVGGTLQVASYNVLNFFTTFSGGTGPDGDLNPRGADNQEEFDRQSTKIVDGILGTGAEVVALQEIENNGTQAIGTLVDLLNAEGTDANYAYVDPTGTGGFIGSDAITTGIVYDSNAVTLVHSDYHVFDESSADVTYGIAGALGDLVGFSFNDYQRNRPSVAATFVDNESGESFTVVSSHFKSKGDSDLQDVADAAESWLNSNAGHADAAAVTDLLDDLYADPNFDQGNGQGFWNAVRLDGATELADWVSSEYGVDGNGVSNYLLLGDMNSYAEEDAVQHLEDEAGLTDLIDTFIGQDEAYSYVFDGQQGTLDQGFADNNLADNVTGVTEWHINADEPDLIGYDTSFSNAGFYNDGVFASSDHDPLIVGLDFTTTNDLPLS